jgi:hypothetical protein
MNRTKQGAARGSRAHAARARSCSESGEQEQRAPAVSLRGAFSKGRKRRAMQLITRAIEGRVRCRAAAGHYASAA